MDVFCVGMYRSGSTWQYNVASRLLERHRNGVRLGFVTGETYTSRRRVSGWRVLKSHDAHPSFAQALTAGKALALYSYRDLRDVCYSLIHKLAGTFATVIERQGWLHCCLDNDRFWRAQRGVLCQRYEELMSDPIAAIEAIAAHLGLRLVEGEATALAEEFALTANRRRAQQFADRLHEAGIDPTAAPTVQRWDGETLLHWNHIREGRVGGWHTQATPRELATLAAVCGRWLIDHGYEPDLAWALPALEHLQDAVKAAHQALHEVRTELAERERELLEIRRLGPVALALARGFHAAAVRFPRLTTLLRQLTRGWRADTAVRA